MGAVINLFDGDIKLEAVLFRFNYIIMY